jgi:hypothetical protein
MRQQQQQTINEWLSEVVGAWEEPAGFLSGQADRGLPPRCDGGFPEPGMRAHEDRLRFNLGNGSHWRRRHRTNAR